MSKRCTPLWREAHVEVNLYKTPQLRSLFNSYDVEKVHVLVARIKKEKVCRRKIQVREKVGKSRNTVLFRWFVAPEGRKAGSLKQLLREAHVQVKMHKHLSVGPLLEVEMLKKCTPLWREARLEVKMLKTCSDHFWTFRCRFAWQVRGIVHRVKSAQNASVCSMSKTMAGVGHLKRIWKDTFSVAGTVQETCSSEMLGGPGADFLRGVRFWSIGSSVLGRWFCVTGAALCMTLPHFFVAGAIL